MKELRDIKLDLLMGNQNPIVDLFNQITKDIKIINTNVYNEEGLEFIYYQPYSNEWIFFQDAKNDNFWCNFATYWSFFEYKIGLEYLEIQSITKYLVEEALKREVATPKNTVVAAQCQYINQCLAEATRAEGRRSTQTRGGNTNIRQI